MKLELTNLSTIKFTREEENILAGAINELFAETDSNVMLFLAEDFEKMIANDIAQNGHSNFTRICEELILRSDPLDWIAYTVGQQASIINVSSFFQFLLYDLSREKLIRLIENLLKRDKFNPGVYE